MSRWLSTSKYAYDAALLQPRGLPFARRPVDGAEWRWRLLMVVGGGWGRKEEVGGRRWCQRTWQELSVV